MDSLVGSEQHPEGGVRATADDEIGQFMRETLEEGLSRVRERRVRIRDLHRDSSSRKSSFQTVRLGVTTDDGEPELRVYLKDLHPRNQATRDWTQRSVDRPPERREVQMYESVLSRERFGTPEFYGSRWEPEHGRCWLFIEDVGDQWLKGRADFGPWVDAARWAARFHAGTRHFAVAQPAFLPVCDEDYYRHTAERVEQMLPRLNAADGDIVRRGLAYFTPHIEALSMLPRCVIHRQFFGANIILRPSPAIQEFAVIDWETAALGPGLFDLVSIGSQRPTEERNIIWRAYMDEYQAEAGQPLNWEVFHRACLAVAVHYDLEWLVWWSEYPEPTKSYRKFLRFLRELNDLVEETRILAAV
jgi:thiamine kinase-like enzyme